MQTTILLVDDHRILRQGLRSLLERENGFNVIAEADEGRTAVKLARELSPQVVVMDCCMPNLNGIEATRQTVAAGKNVKVIALSAVSDARMTREMLRAGAAGFVLKDAAVEELVAAIHTVMEDKVYVSPSLCRQAAMGEEPEDARDAESGFTLLSSREREILQLLAEGLSTKEVAANLKVSSKTVETHRRNIMEKTGLDSVAELTKYALREGITSL